MKSKMDKRIGLIGAGGKMGCRITDNLLKTEYDVIFCENGEAGKKRLADRGISTDGIEKTAKESDIIVLAVPDVKIKEISEYILPMVRRDTTLILLDPAAAYAGELALRDDCTFVVAHPCHPPLFGKQDTDEARNDFFGGIAAKQDIVIALVQGREDLFDIARQLCIDIFAPVVKCHRITVEQMALLEPAAAEVVIAAAATIMKEALDEVVKMGVPEEAARSFLLGHIQIPLAIAFNEIDSPFSDGAKIAIKCGL